MRTIPIRCRKYELLELRESQRIPGMAGMSFSNFMKKGATENLTNTLGITSLDSSKNYTSGNRKYLTKALCLVGPDNITSSSRCTSETKWTGTRGVPEREISFFSILGDMIYLNYGVLDTDLNGDISKTETDNFSGLFFIHNK